MLLQIADKRPTKRVVYVPWDRPLQETGIFEMEAGIHDIKIWLPRGVELEYLEVLPYIAPKIPVQAQNYKPKYLPPNEHPRLWVSKEGLPLVKANLSKTEHIDLWEKLSVEARRPFVLPLQEGKELSYSEEVEKIAEVKAFYYLMTDDKKIGREAIDLMLSYIQNVEFGNILDITRELGRAIYTASLVYDWTYDLINQEEKKIFRHHLMRLARDMEIGWPPFKMGIVNGHGNEAMVNRDFLAMSIALYNEDPLPYQYISYSILEELVPMRKFEYQSPRHNQGVGYGAYRFAWEMHAAMLYYKMLNKKVFDDNIMDLHKFWLYMRAPDGQMLRDGDGFVSGKPGQAFYWKHPLAMFMIYSYSGNPIMKGEYIRQGGIGESNPVLFLLLNDPFLKPETSLASLPLTLDFGPVLGGMVARTGWNVGPESDDVVAEIKGGGYHFGNHQHSDAGAIQLFYRGFQFGDIGVYRFYGTPYDMGFNKRSVAHSMMLARDPEEKFTRSEVNDGGTKLNQKNPKSPEEAISDKWFHNGNVVSSSFGPLKEKPFYSYFSVDLASAYSDKVTDYTRSFCFLNLNRPDIPAIIVMKDEMTTKSPEFKKYWQINTLNLPEIHNNTILLHNNLKGRKGKTFIEVKHDKDLEIQVLSAPEATNVFGTQLEVPETDYAEGKGHRILVSSKSSNKSDKFITIFQVLEGSAEPIPVDYIKQKQADLIYIKDEAILLLGDPLTSREIEFEVKNKNKVRMVLAGLKSGKWRLYSEKRKQIQEISIKAKENTGFIEIKKGKYNLKYLE